MTWLLCVGGGINNLYKFLFYYFFYMKKTLLWLLALSIIGIWWIGIASADTGCWSTYGTPPTTTYASGIVYWCDENNIPIITIYWEDGKWITIKAMNEWTWTVKIWSGDDTSSYWSLYQWWNNYPFPNVSDSTTTIISATSAVNASNYLNASWYYYSGTWIK